MANIFVAPQLFLKKPDFDGLNMTNHVLVEGPENTGQITYYLPAYLRMKIKNFAGLEQQDLQGTVNVDLLLDINHQQIHGWIVEYMKKNLIMRFNRDDAIILDSKENFQVKMKPMKDEVIRFTVRKILNASMKSDIWLTPFEKLFLIISINLPAIVIEKEDYEQFKQKIIGKHDDDNPFENKEKKLNKITIRFNLMDLENKQQLKNRKINKEEKDDQFFKYQFVKISYTQQGEFGEYDLAESLLNVEYSNQGVPSQLTEEHIERAKKRNKQGNDYSKISEFNHGHFLIPLYKHPMVSLCTIFIPLWLLGLFNLGIFFQDTGLADRIGSLAALMIAFIALIPVVRDQLPANPSITLVEILVYLETFTTLLCLGESISVRHFNENQYDFLWWQNGWFMVSAVITTLEILIIVCLIFWHYCYRKGQLNMKVDNQKEKKFQYEKWSNHLCDEHFKRKIDNGSIDFLQVQNKDHKQQQRPIRDDMAEQEMRRR